MSENKDLGVLEGSGDNVSSQEWISVKDRLPANGVEVQVLQGNSRVVTNLKRYNNLWFLPDGSMYVYYQPSYWMPLSKD